MPQSWHFDVDGDVEGAVLYPVLDQDMFTGFGLRSCQLELDFR